tara:strand:- start:228 stop:542 length:315 start_codon:yes stop_codon:yes gene_type:complete
MPMGRVRMPYTKKDANGNTIKGADGKPVRDLEKDKPENKENTQYRSDLGSSRRAENRKRAVRGLAKLKTTEEMDHKTPASKGGSNAPSNMRVVSRETNRKKYNK